MSSRSKAIILVSKERTWFGIRLSSSANARSSDDYINIYIYRSVQVQLTVF